MKMKLTGLGLLAFASMAHAQSDTPMDMKSIDQKEFKAFLGPWEIRNEKGNKKCRVKLKSDDVIGGMGIDVAKSCGKTFPLMNEVFSWRLNEGWEIVLVDATRKTLIRFYTPDNEYISDKEIDGIFTIVKK